MKHHHSPSDIRAAVVALVIAFTLACQGTRGASDEGVYPAADYRLSGEGIARWLEARSSLDAATPAAPTIHLATRSTSADEVTVAVNRLEADSAARRIIEGSGLTVRDYVLTTLAVGQALDASEHPRIRFLNLPASNLEIVRARREELQRRNRAARFLVVDERDTDRDTDRRGDRRDTDTDTERDTGKDTEKDTDRETDTDKRKGDPDRRRG